MRALIFLTGMQRSGTTLLGRLLDARGDMRLLSQPFPLLHVEAKRAFLREYGADESTYPLGHLLGAPYEVEAFARFLRHWGLPRDALRALLDALREYDGQYTRVDPVRVEAVWREKPFVEQLAEWYRELAGPAARFAGGKETTCEEFLPALLEAGFRAVLILRDPRDVLASLNHGEGPRHAGAPKPTLFNIRQWRKSVAFALALEGHPGFHWLRYEDLVTDPEATQERLEDALALPPAPCAVGWRAAAAGWESNSSHGPRAGLSPDSLGAFVDVLPPAVIELVEATCAAELRCLGYAATPPRAPLDILANFREPYLTRTEMSAEQPSATNLALESARLRALDAAECAGPAARELFVFERAFQRLCEAGR